MFIRIIGAATVTAGVACAGILLGADTLPADVQDGSRIEEPGGAWPDNEPAGMTVVLHVDGSSKNWPGFETGGAWMDDDRVAVVDDPESKYGQAIEKRFFAGDKSGWHGITHRANFGAFRELYQRIVFRVSSNWQWHSSGSKFFYWGGAGRPPRRSPTQFYVNATGAGQVQFVNQSGSGEPDSRGTFRTIAPPITRDRYHTIEILHIANSPGRSDGALHMWIDGMEVKGFNHLGRRDRRNVQLENIRWLDYIDTRLTGIEALMFWGGQGDRKRVNDWIRLSELYISGKH